MAGRRLSVPLRQSVNAMSAWLHSPQATIPQHLVDTVKFLVKAPYYVSADEPSRQLNAQRPRYYDPKRPPAASKATVAGTGRKGRGITLDMIAVAAP